MIRWTLVVLASAFIAWCLGQTLQRQWYGGPLPPPEAWGPGRNAFDCQTGAPVTPLDPTLTEAQRQRVLVLLKQACEESAR